MKSDLEVRIAELAMQDRSDLKGSEVTVSGFLAGEAEEPLEDGYNYPFIDENMNGILVKSQQKLNHLERGKWFNITGMLDSTHQQEMHVTSEANVEPSHSHKATPPQEKQFISSVKKVVDGDTIHLETPVLGTTKVRFVSIDTPETNYQGQSQGYHAEEATRQLEYLLPLGERVDIHVGDEPFDQYGRLLAVVVKNEQNINLEMIELGMAVPYFIYPNLVNFNEYGEAVVRAKEFCKGIWNPERPIDELPYEFRFNKRGGPNKFVGHHATKMYVEPSKWESVPIEYRVFFLNEKDAKDAGYDKVQDSNQC
ncbi:thermonuclease family protein [Pseudalkalibacillus berkeleyi]|uniref:Thermonuclease family protein n=1 Tax=Pseudalkalibacillus berkeleyi TaxID=1069813 RepID=A0ABS9H487_9BACL|nr:thermonuclease family protein [Pseudalkalibacillus berkeleyi]MCF6138652.1 thermonuclease family protein [Pseudalkalibacillus berkeleyi]